MCFSATASFAASGVLLTLGGASLAHASKKERVLVAIPLLFAVQQGIEGVQWLYLNQGLSSPAAAYGFLFFALIVWPVYVPLAVFLLDKKKGRALSLLVILGILVGIFFAHMLLTQSVVVIKKDACIDYIYGFPYRYLVSAGYTLAIFLPLLLSSLSVFRKYGMAIILLALVSALFFIYEFTSVWCFFAAVVSSMFYLHVRGRSAP